MPGLTVARIALGCGNFGGVGSAPEFFGQGLTQDEAFALMDAAWESGIVHFDTADAYGGGRSEQAIGRWISSRGVRPRLTTKTFNPMQAGADHGLEPGPDRPAAPPSLDRLGVDQIDLYLAHDYDPAVPLAEASARLARPRPAACRRLRGQQLRRRGNWRPRSRPASPQAIQNSYSLLARQDEPEVLPLCAERGVAYLAFSPLAGRLADRQVPPRRAIPGGLADDAAARAVPGAGHRPYLRGARRGWKPSRPAAAPRWPASRSPGCWPTSGWLRS